MASVFGHAVSAFGLSKVFPKWKMTRTVVFLGIISSILPDIDVLAFRYGVTETHWLGHRGFTHSIPFAIFWASVLVLWFHQKEVKKGITWSYYFITTCSHGFLDAMTTGGEGVGFWMPLSNERIFLPWRVIEVSPIGAAHFLGEWGLKVLANEVIYIGIPTLFLIILGISLNNRFYSTPT